MGHRLDRVRREPGSLQVALRDRKRPGDGGIELTFAAPALELRHWTVTDSQGGKTYVSLTDIQIGIPLDPKLFFFEESQSDNQNN